MRFFILLGLILASCLYAEDKVENNDSLLKELLSFYQERDWEQFHSPKNLVMDLAAETGELVELFRWLTEEQSRELDEKTLQEVRGEIADIYKCIIYLSYKLDIEPVKTTFQKLEKMRQKYPVGASRGKALKYTAYAPEPSNDIINEVVED